MLSFVNNTSSRNVIVTGASGGIGQATAIEFARQGYNVCVHYFQDFDGASKVVDSIHQHYPVKAFLFGGDISDERVALSLIHETQSQFGSIDVLVNIAGISPKNNGSRIFTEDTDPDQWDSVMKINLKGMFLTCKYAIPIFKEQKKGKIINMSSIVGRTGLSGPAGAHYAASKGAIITFTKTLAKELGPFDINVNCVAPGWIKTPLTEKIQEDQTEALLKEIPLQRFGSVQDVANVISFLASSQSDYITGTTIDVNGGWYMQ